MQEFIFEKSDMLMCRTGSDGFQPKFITKDRQYFVKCQATIDGLLMNDWLVEVIATHFCKQLSIPCIIQKPCTIFVCGREYKGVYSDNFELKSWGYKSFETLLNENKLSTNEDYFIRLSTIDKIEWCVEHIHWITESISKSRARLYLLDLAVLDCLVGNSDRHTRNFGIMTNQATGKVKVADIFDSGMGLFENTSYRDTYDKWTDGLRELYVAPYGEDPFEMIDLLQKEYNIKNLYDFDKLSIPDELPNKLAEGYLKEMITKLSML